MAIRQRPNGSFDRLVDISVAADASIHESLGNAATSDRSLAAPDE
jgi:hypothetical protein